MDKIFPNMVNTRNGLEDSKEIPKTFKSEGRGPQNSTSMIKNRVKYSRYNPHQHGATIQQTNKNTSQYSQDEGRMRGNFRDKGTSGGHSKSIIRREKDVINSRSGFVRALENNSTFTVRLTQF